MKKFVVYASFIFCLIIVVVALTSCGGRKSGRLNDQRKVSQKIPEIKVMDMVSDTLVATPDKIGATDIMTTVMSHVDANGGEYVSVNYIIGLQIREKLHQLYYSEEIYIKDIDHVTKDDMYIIADLIHLSLKKIPAEQVRVFFVNNEIVEVCSKEVWKEDGVFVPSITFWEKK